MVEFEFGENRFLTHNYLDEILAMFDMRIDIVEKFKPKNPKCRSTPKNYFPVFRRQCVVI